VSHVCDGRDAACASCKAIARRLDTVRSAMTLDDELDDIKRARIWTQLEDRLAEPAPLRRPRRAIAIAVAAAAVVAAVVAVLPRRDALHTLTVPVDTVVASQLGAHTAASIVGPAELEILPGAGEVTAVRLDRGTLLAEFDGGAGRSLRVETREAVVEVVGTLFAVEVRGGSTCTSVVHGRVRVTAASGVVYVAAGERHCTGEPVRPIREDMRTALTRHGSRDRAVTERKTAVAAPAPAIEAAAPAAAAPAPPPAVAAPAPPAAPSRAREAPRLPRLDDPPAAPAARPAEISAAPPSVPPHAEPIAPAAPPKPTPDELYRTAEAALAAHDAVAADRALAALVTEHPGSTLVDQALYERARIAYQQHAWLAARRHLAQLATMTSASFAEPGHYLRCRIAVETSEATAATCLADYRAAFPRSPHDLDALGLLVRLAHARGGCGGAESLIDELAQSYPRTTLAAAWRARCPEPR
jgi:TolA-binding protein